MANNNERNSVYLFDENGKIFPDILGYMKEVPPRYSIYRSDRRIIISDMMSFEGIYTSADEKADRKILNKYIRRVIENYLKYISLRSDQEEIFEKMAEFIYQNRDNSINKITGPDNSVCIGKFFFSSKGISNNIFDNMDVLFKVLRKFFKENCRLTLTKFIQLFLLYLIHSFCSFKRSLRQYIYCYDIANEIENQTKLGTECIKIEIKVYNRFNCEEEKKIFYFRHYVLREDNEVNSYYLVGYSRSAENSNVGIYSTKLNNIIRVSKDIGYSFPDQPKEYSKMKVEDRIQQNGAAFANRVPIKKKSWVYLTASGYNYLYLISVQHLRPIPYEKPELLPEDEVIVINGNKYVYRLTFECSPRQLYNYFFSMGEDAYVPQKFMKNGEEQCNNDETYKLFSDTAVSLYKMYRTENSDENEK